MYSLNPAHVAGCYDQAVSGLLRQSFTQPLTCGNSWPICFHVPTPAKLLCPLSLFCEDFILFTAAQDFRFLTKSSCIGSGQGQQKDALRRHTVHLILCSGFHAVADKRQRFSAASEPCRRMCPISAPHRCPRSRSAACAGAAGTSGCPRPQPLSGSSCAPGVWLDPFPRIARSRVRQCSRSCPRNTLGAVRQRCD